LKLLTHINQIDQQLPESPLKAHIQSRFAQLSEDTDVPPNLVLVEANDDVTGPGYAFVGPEGLLSDLLEEARPGHDEFVRSYEWVSHTPW
jgi:hypothetical protein